MRLWLLLFTTLVLAAFSGHVPSGESSVNRSPTDPLNIGPCGANSAFCQKLSCDRTVSEASTSHQNGFSLYGEVPTQSAPFCAKDSGTASRKIAYYEGW